MRDVFKNWWQTFCFVMVQLGIFVFIFHNHREGFGWACLVPLVFIPILVWSNVARLRSGDEIQKMIDEIKAEGMVKRMVPDDKQKNG